MPRNEKPVVQIEDLTAEKRKQQPRGGQEHWYWLATQHVNGCSVLDVGAGVGDGLCILQTGEPASLTGIDPQSVSSDVQRMLIEQLRDNSFDIVTSFDVIEHVEDDVGFLNELLRVATKVVYLSTPNWNVWHCENAFHVREYAPEELGALLGDHQYIAWTAGSNRLIYKPRVIYNLEDANSSFCVAIRGSFCTDAEWQEIAANAQIAAENCIKQLSVASKDSHEWTSHFETELAGKHPLDAAMRALEILKASLILHEKEFPYHTEDLIEILRLGHAGPRQQAIIIAWALNSFVLGPAGPHVNMCSAS